MQFPLLHAGKPFTGERGMIPGVRYCLRRRFVDAAKCREAWKHYQAHPKGPYTYSCWDSFPGRAEARPTHARWLKQYMPMVEEGTWAWLEIGDSSLFRACVAERCCGFRVRQSRILSGFGQLWANPSRA